MTTADFHIIVTQDDIDKGCKSHTINCPVARALQRCTDRFAIECGTFDVYDGNGTIIGELPNRVSHRIRAFDDDGGMVPFEFDIALEAYAS